MLSNQKQGQMSMTERNLQEELSLIFLPTQQSGSSQLTIRLKSRDYSSIVHFTLQTKIDTHSTMVV